MRWSESVPVFSTATPPRSMSRAPQISPPRRMRPGMIPPPSSPHFRHSFLILVLVFTAIHGFSQTPSAQAAPAARFVVVLDAAHGGDDAGASLEGQPE